MNDLLSMSEYLIGTSIGTSIDSSSGSGVTGVTAIKRTKIIESRIINAIKLLCFRFIIFFSSVIPLCISLQNSTSLLLLEVL